MATESRTGRPRASSREVLSEAACELFLEKGYDATSVSDITRRAGVSRSSFFNYFSAKSDVLWSGLDARVDTAVTELRGGGDVRDVLRAIGDGLAPDALACRQPLLSQGRSCPPGRQNETRRRVCVSALEGNPAAPSKRASYLSR